MSGAGLVQKQGGFTLLELSIVLFIGSGFLMAMTLSMHSHMLQLRVQTMAQRYQVLQAAAQRYVQAYQPVLSALPADCSTSAWQADSPRPPAGVVAMGACSLELKIKGRAVKVSNGMQPGIDELQWLGLLDVGAAVELAFDRDVRVYRPSFVGQGFALAPQRLAVLVRKHCEALPCSTSARLEALVFNLQPFLLDGGHWVFDRQDQLNLLLNMLGDDAAISRASDDGRLQGAEGRFTLVNPVQEVNGSGTPGILALRSSAQGPMDAVWARRDGQTVITGDWDFGSRQLKGVSTLGATTVQVQHLQLSGRAELNTATVQSLQVQRLSPEQLRLPVAVVDQTCDPQQANLALDVVSGRLLTCQSTSMQWRLP